MAYSAAVDRKWQDYWEDTKQHRFSQDRIDRKLYVLEMFSYPSAANLHVGHWYNYALADSWARMKKMQGYEIFQPMGFDAFGLPAENYAIRTGIHPQDSTLSNIKTMRKQLSEMGGMFDWDAELATCLPDYYRWNQWLFLQLYHKGLAYRKNAPVNWCPQCQTVLANEQVVEGSCERCHTDVVRKNLTQWFFRITDYAQELLDGLDQLDWPEKTKKIQINWIGRSEGAEIVFGAQKNGQPVIDESGQTIQLPVFTTRADTLMGVTYVVVAPESDVCRLLTTDERRNEVEQYQSTTSRVSDIDRMSSVREKTGVFTGSYAIHPLTGEKLPIWTSDYVIAGYGTGVVMAVPAHDERDFEFATQFDLPIRRVIRSADQSADDLPFTDKGILTDSGRFSEMTSDEAINAMLAELEPEGRGQLRVNYRLRDWLVSRQRYWGTPIPIVYCQSCGTVPVPEDQLPVRLPYNVEFTPDGESPLKKCTEFIETVCPHCGGPATRDADTLDTFVCSSWYQFRYTDNRNDREAFSRDIVDRMCPVDKYVGGAEHAAMHLLYARFITKALRDMGYLGFDEPFKSLVHQGTILGADGQKMSKSRGNTISPDSYVSQYGSDVFRLYLAFGFAYTEGGPWSDDGVRAIAKFVSRIDRLVDDYRETPAGRWQIGTDSERELQYARHHAIKAVTIDAEKFQFNTSVSRMMELLNALNHATAQKQPPQPELVRDVIEDLIRLIAPFAPHFAEEMWEKMGHQPSIFHEMWPKFDEQALVRERVEIAVQVNGTIKFRMEISPSDDRKQIEKAVMADPRTEPALESRTVRRVIVVPGRLVNLVV
ncbi:MAG: leucine--tRNA ligase [Eubacteriales bacterium]|nr:leucine--tRNA ligase [Eubacteriales bacterium]MDD3866080.1 leucine--tRNA ligase [Eubacteriales bacterium]MDD4460890.1 leucine--tRNA ligase [Eubacteriales bacterium]